MDHYLHALCEYHSTITCCTETEATSLQVIAHPGCREPFACAQHFSKHRSATHGFSTCPTRNTPTHPHTWPQDESYMLGFKLRTQTEHTCCSNNCLRRVKSAISIYSTTRVTVTRLYCTTPRISHPAPFPSFSRYAHVRSGRVLPNPNIFIAYTLCGDGQLPVPFDATLQSSFAKLQFCAQSRSAEGLKISPRHPSDENCHIFATHGTVHHHNHNHKRYHPSTSTYAATSRCVPL